MPSKPSIHCAQCATEVSAERLSCPNCHALVYADRLKELASAAEVATQHGDLVAALQQWNDALQLLPPGSKQYFSIALKVRELNDAVVDMPSHERSQARKRHKKLSKQQRSRLTQGAMGLGAVGVFMLTKGKFLLAGLTKMSTLMTMLASFGAYWTIWGWKFAAGLVLSIYVHEMGHVMAFRRFGIRADAPMFIPGFGAMVRARQNFTDERVEARVALAGPNWGLAAALVCALVYWVTAIEILAAIAHIGAWINLLNLLPVWQLDGARTFRALTFGQRWLCSLAFLGLSWVYSESVFSNLRQSFDVTLVIVAGVGIVVSLSGRGSQRGDRYAMANTIFLGAALGAINAFVRTP